MKWAWKIGTLGGIEIKIHVTFLLILIWAGLTEWVAKHDLIAVFAGIGFVIAVFACVVLHELGHALAAKKFGIKTRDITLLPIGGLARLERMPDDPKQEIWVALAGPAVNVLIAIILYAWMQFNSAWELFSRGDLLDGSFAERLMIVNIVLIVFNLLPAFPMDGGRVLRGFLAMRMNYAHATQIAAKLGQVMAFLFGVAGFFSNPFLIFIAVFVWIGAAQEATLAEMKSILGGVSVEDAMLTNFVTISPNDLLSQVVELVLAGSQHDFPVIEDGNIVGLLTRSDLVLALAKHGQTVKVSDVMKRDFKIVDASELLENIFPRLQSSECKIMPVTRLGGLVGLITLENVGEFVMIRSALKQTRQAA